MEKKKLNFFNKNIINQIQKNQKIKEIKEIKPLKLKMIY